MNEARAEQAAAASQPGWPTTPAKIRSKIRGNVVAWSNQGNPEALFTVTQLPSGEGDRREIEEIERQRQPRCRHRTRDPEVLALPKPTAGAVPAVLEIKYRPFED